MSLPVFIVDSKNILKPKKGKVTSSYIYIYLIVDKD